MKPSTFRVLLVWIDGWEAFADAELEEELAPEHITALGQAGAARRKGFLLLARRNWQLEYQARRVHLPAHVRGLFQLPEGEAVDRLLGWHDGAERWHPGLAGLEPAEAQAIRLRFIDYLQPKDIAWALGVKRTTIDNRLWEGRRKIRRWFGLTSDPRNGVVFAKELSAHTAV